MKTCKIYWVGTSKKGASYVGVEYEAGDFLVRKFIRVKDGVDLAKYEKGSEISVPLAALS